MSAVSARRPLASPSRILAVSLPRLETDRILRERLGRSWRSARPLEADPLVLHDSIAGANRIVALCERAASLGLVAGLGLIEARARFPAIEARESEPAADAALLEALADWCDRYTPLVALDPPHGLVLDISGCAHLFGGEAALMDDLLSRLFHLGFAAKAALASSPGPALALVTAGQSGAIVAEGEEQAAVQHLPIAALRLSPALRAMLERLGLKTIGTLLSLPREGLARRFGKELLTQLDEATGRAARPIGPRRPVAPLMAERRFAFPLTLVEDIAMVLGHLADRLKGDLERRGEGARRLELALFRVDGRVERIEVSAARPVREPTRIRLLFRERIGASGDELDAGFGYDCIRLSALVSEALPDRQTDLAGEAAEEDLGLLVDRIGARLGTGSILRMIPRESHRPERAARLVPASRPSDTRETSPPFTAPRPVRFLAEPEPVEAIAEVPEGPPMRFRWRRTFHDVRRVEGPERVGAEWWREEAGKARDYFRVEDQSGRRYWLFREGLYGGEERPVWYLHGFFA